MNKAPFAVIQQDSTTSARTGSLVTRHGTVQTPVFMPVGTQATVKGLLPSQLQDLGAQIILGNTYHLHLRPGADLIRDLGGLHHFMQWQGPILTDSGGFQVFSLSQLRNISEQGVTFRSHLDGKKIFLGPCACYHIQASLGSDIAMVLDECPPWPCEYEPCQSAVMRTIRWAEQFMTLAGQEGFLERGHLVFGIVQGSGYADLRKRCAEALVALDCSGYAVGGVSVGEPEPEMLQQISLSVPYLPYDKPRYAMGLGTPPQLLKMIALGIDMFDCVMPTRLARHGHVFTPEGTLNLRNERFKADPRPIVEGLDNLTCRQFSRAYLRHLLVAGELLAATLLSIHNLHFLMDLMRQARQHIADGTYGTWHLDWIERYRQQAHRKGQSTSLQG